MTAKQREHLEQRLLRERERAIRALRTLDERTKQAERGEDGDLTTYPFHLADEGTDTMEREKGFLLLSKEGRLVYWIDDALRTLYKTPEEYGKCSDCGARIAFERLDIVPWARLCVDCQRKDEHRQEVGLGEAA
ncbi:MAG TPA: TraR/DksA family transcriptional regulator [Longimicrobiales bacterium]|nr:TraR/DksA family transcriptional regulator [Longimicrobiales bacterium]